MGIEIVIIIVSVIVLIIAIAVVNAVLNMAKDVRIIKEILIDWEKERDNQQSNK